MNISDVLFFAPGIPFSKVDLEGPELPDQLRQRIAAFYIEPARDCCAREQSFAAGVILVSCIDALARFSSAERKVSRATFKRFVRENIPSCQPSDVANRFYDEIRCGLVHEARLKNGAQFCLDPSCSTQVIQGILIVNPNELAAELETALDRYIVDVRSNDCLREALAVRLKDDYEKDHIGADRAH